jgi:hypothetical protein
MTATHVHEHDQMIGLADDILRRVARAGAGERGGLAQLRLAFARLVNKHCTEEGKTIADAVKRGLLSESLVSSFQGDLLRWRTDLAICNSEWPLARVLGDPKGFERQFGDIAKRLRDYIARENSEILEVIGRHPSGANRGKPEATSTSQAG